VADRVTLGLRADTLQETLLHEVAAATGAYEEERVLADVTIGPSEDGLDVGLAASLLEHAAGDVTWDVQLVVCVEPLFWLAGPEAARHQVARPLPPAVEHLLELALRRGPPAGPSGADGAVLGPAAVTDVAVGRLHPWLDVGMHARFPAVGIAGRAGAYDPGVAARVVRAHRSALAELHRGTALVGRILVGRYGVAPEDAPAVLAIVRQRFRDTSRSDARVLAHRGFADLDRSPRTLAGAFGRAEVQA
jgi:hypothetical protein